MRNLDRRLDALETASGMKGGWDYRRPCHAIIMDEHQPHTEALAEYRTKHPDLTINPTDNVMWIQIVSPQLDGNGSVITHEKSGHDDGPSLAEVLALETRQ